MRRLYLLGVAGAVVCCVGDVGAQVPSQRELNGFVIGQNQDAIRSSFGDPYQEEQTEDGWLYLMYLTSEEPIAYFVFKFSASETDRVISMQYAGDPDPDMRLFAGVHLGSTAADVRQIFGPPTSTRDLVDPPFEVWLYDGMNYSFEFDQDQRLSSIQIFGLDGFSDPEDYPMPKPWEEVLALLESTDPETLMQGVASDAEVYRGDDCYFVDGSLWSVVSDPNSPFRSALAQVVEALQTSSGWEPIDVNMRMSTDLPLCIVYKFAGASPVSEVVLINEAGDWRLWEIAYR